MKRFLLGLFVLFYLSWLLFPYSHNALTVDRELVIQDRNGEELARFSDLNKGYGLSMTLRDCPKNFVSLLLFSEDRTFYYHHGISLRAIVRVLWQFLQKGRFSSGGSTITQQLVKIRAGIRRNNLWTKFLELHRAIKLDLHFTKEDILTAYLNQVSLGHQIHGFQLAAHHYFKKDMWQLNLLEQAALIKLLQQPSNYDPYRHPLRLERMAKNLLRRDAQNLNVADLKLALKDRLSIQVPEQEWFAPHFSQRIREWAKTKNVQTVRTTLDLELYCLFQQVAKNRINLIRYNPGIQASALMIDNETGEILVYMGSSDFWGESGQVDGVRMKRQPGSTMKPFVYALALNEGLLTPASIIPDIPTDFPAPVGKYIPQNYDRRFHGPVRMAVALASSYNVPAIWTIHHVGLFNVYHFLKSVGFESLKRPARFYGLGLALGNADVSLYEMVRAYSLFSRGGTPVSLKNVLAVQGEGKWETVSFPDENKKGSVSPESAALITHILSDFSYKVPAFGVNSPLRFPFPVAVKTGTSKNFRDNTIFAYTPRFTIGVWMGTFSGKTLREMPSSLGAGVILRDILLELHNRHPDWFPVFDYSNLNLTTVKICSLSGKLAGPRCNTMSELFVRGSEPTEICDWEEKGLPSLYCEWAMDHYFPTSVGSRRTETALILSPHASDTFRIDPSVDRAHQAISLKASVNGGLWTINGRHIGQGQRILWVLEPGRQNIRYELPDGTAYTVSIFVVE